MKARVPKEWTDLSPRSQHIVSEYCVGLLNDQEEKDMRIVLERIIKMFCCVLHDTEGFDETKLWLLIGNLQTVFKEQAKLVSKKQQMKFLDERMEKIFPANGFPQAFIDALLGEKDQKTIEGIKMEELLGCKKQ
jgi:hypothetical protein